MKIDYDNKQALKATSLPNLDKIQAISVLGDVVETYICKGKTKKEIYEYIRRMNSTYLIWWGVDRYTFIFDDK